MQAKPHSLLPPLAECTPNGWCRVANQVPGNPVELVHVDAPDRFWAAAIRDVVFRWDGTKLAHVRVPIDRQIFALWGDGTEGWIAGKTGDHRDAVFRVRDGKLTPVSVSASSNITAIDGDGGHVWLMGSSELVHVHPDGKQETVATPKLLARAIWVAGPADVWIAGSERVVRYQDGTWTELPALPVDIEGHSSIDGTDESSVWVVAGRRTFFWDGKAWSERTRKAQAYRSVVTVVTKTEVVLHDPGGHDHEHAEVATFTDRWATPTKVRGLVAVHGKTMLLARTGFELRTPDDVKRIPVGAGIHANAIWASAKGVWIGGRELDTERAAVAVWDGTTWSHTSFIEGAEIVSIDGYDEPLLLGRDGKLWRGRRFEESGVFAASKIVAGAGDEAWVLGGDVLARRVGGTWKAVQMESMYVSAPGIGSDGSVFVMQLRWSNGQQVGTLYRWDGATFVQVADVAHQSFEQPIVHSATRIDILNNRSITSSGKSVVTGEVSDVLRMGELVFVSGGISPPEVSDPKYLVVDVPYATIAGDAGLVWAMKRPSGELWVKAVPEAKRTPPTSPHPSPR